MTLYPLKVHLQTFLSIPVTQKCQILSCDTLVANERYGAQIVFMCLVRISEQPKVLPYTTSPGFFFTAEVVSVYYAVRTEPLHIKQITFHD